MEREIKTLSELSLKDPLTGVHNRRYLEERLAEIHAAVVSGRLKRVGVLAVDIDFFKKVNDTYGHQAGDLVLREVAKLLGEQVRKSDVLARTGGEEFTILLPNKSERQIVARAEQIRENVAGHSFVYEGEEISVTISIGVAVHPEISLKDGREERGDEISLLLKAADAALYAAKEAGRNKVISAGDMELFVSGSGRTEQDPRLEIIS